MRTTGASWLSDITAPSRVCKGKAELYRGSDLINTFLPTDILKSIQIEKTPLDGHFFGYTICQKAIIELLDKNNTLDVEKGDKIHAFLGTENELIGNPTFYVEEVTRDEVKHNVKIVAYDLINQASKHLFSELDVVFPVTPRGYSNIIANKLGTTALWNASEGNLALTYTADTQPNLSGSETLREVLAALAELNGCICFMNVDNKLEFKQLSNEPVGTINKSDYFELTIGKEEKLSQISSTTELGDNLTHGEEANYNYIIRNNPFIENRSDIPTILSTLLEITKDIVFYPYTIKWRSNPAIDIGDCIAVMPQNDIPVALHYLGETITYTGGMVASSSWSTTEQEKIETNPTTIGDAIKDTYAKVDKVNRVIDLVASEVEGNTSKIAALQINTDSISSSVESITTKLDTELDGVSNELATLTERVESTITKDELKIAISEELADGIDKIITSTGYTFDEDGLTIEKSDSEMKTKITEDGMTVYRDNDAVLIADNTGVKATNLHATTYLIIGTTSRFEDYINLAGEQRTGCFWILN